MQNNLDRYSTINAIRLELRHPSGQNRVWVMVEGEDDVRLYAKFFDDHVHVEMVHGGVEQLRLAVDEIHPETDRVIGIRDADFLHLTGQDETIPCFFLTDHHDAEMTMVMSDVTFKSLVSEYMNDRLCDHLIIRNQILTSLLFLSALKWLNASERLELDFDRFPIREIFDSSTCSLDPVRCLQIATVRSGNKKREPSHEEVQAKILGVDDYANLSNGHDVILVFTINSSVGKRKPVSHKTIASSLRAAYHESEFMQTRLYGLLREWEQRTSHYIFRQTATA